MTLFNKSWLFTSDSDGFSLSNCSWENGGIVTRSSGRNTTVNSTSSITTTYEAIGIPSGAIINDFQLRVYASCIEFNVSDGASWNASSVGISNIPTVSYLLGTQSSTLYTSQISTMTGTTASDSFTITLNGTTDNANDKNALTGLSWDSVSISVNYTLPTNINIDSTYENISVGGYDAEITIENPASIDINIDATESNISLTGYDSIITVSTNVNIDQDFTNISLIGYDSIINTTSNINIDSTYSNITTQGYDTIVSTEAVLNNNIDATYSNLQLSGYDSTITVSTNVNIDQTFSNIGFIGYDVNINTTKNLNIDSTYTNIALQGYDTTVSTEDSQSINIDVLVSNLSLEGYDIQVLTTANVAINVENNTINIQGYNVSVYAGDAEEPPFVDILSATQYKLSYDVDYDSTIVSFSFDKPVVEYRINLLGISPNTGTILDSERKDVENMSFYTVDQINDLTVLDAMSFDADINITDEILANELSLGENRINIYGLGLNDLWTPYEE